MPAWLALAGLLAPLHAPAQEHSHPPAEPAAAWGAQAVPLLTHAAPALYGEARTEGYLTQPMVMGHAALLDGRLRLEGVLNFEGLTLRRGELNAGIWGEGYVDRRHPHTLVHEAMASLVLLDGPGLRATVAGGKGFVPFGTDDPMVRPFVKYPANHHLAQVLERTVAVGAVRAGLVGLEAAVFNGDEPTDPGQVAGVDRFGDSWASRLTLRPLPGVEAQASHARATSPEMGGGQGADQRKWSASLRYQDAPGEGAERYALLEWARTTEYDDGRRGLAYGSVLGEGAISWLGTRLALRWERTERPEEDRLLDPFRSVRPHVGAHSLGLTRWSILSAAASRRATVGPVRLRPFAEAALLRARAASLPSFFVPEEFYGSSSMWSLSLGVRLEAGAVHARMGRYGAAAASGPRHEHH